MLLEYNGNNSNTVYNMTETYFAQVCECPYAHNLDVIAFKVQCRYVLHTQYDHKELYNVY